jgi:nitric oxide reductase NorD protein
VPQAEQVLSDVARQAGGLVQDLWRRRRGKQDLPEMLRQLELMIAGAFGVTVQLQLNRAAIPKQKSRRLFASDDASPAPQSTLPTTDGRSIWLPAAAEDAAVIKEFESLRIMALQQAARVHRGSIATLLQAGDPLVRAIYEVLEADAADIDLVTRFRGLTGPLNAFRRLTLEQRPVLAELPRERRPLEQWLREILEIPCEAAAQAREHPATRSLQLAVELAPELLKDMPGVSRESAGVLHRDAWLGELRTEAVARVSPVVLAEEPHDFKVTAKDKRREPYLDLDRTLFLDAPTKVELAAAEEAPVSVWLDAVPAAEGDLDPSIETTQPMIVAARLTTASLANPLEGTAEEPYAEATAEETAEATPAMRLVQPDVLIYPEWDYRTAAYGTTGTTLTLAPATPGPEGWVDTILDQHHGLLQGIRQRFETLRAQRRQADEVDVDAHVDEFGDMRAGLPQRGPARSARAGIATMLLIDVGASSQEWVSSTHQLIDLQREAVLLACLAMYSLGEPFSLYAFAGDGSPRTSMRCIKEFAEPYTDDVALRIAGLKPERHTRTGAALRHATSLLAQQNAQHRMLLLLSDGAPNDADDYSGRYGMEDVRQAVREARMQGISSLCFTTDQLNGNYLPSVFGEQQSTVLYRPELLPSALVQWLHRLMRL